MLLILTLTGPARLMGSSSYRTLRQGSLTIGRSPTCDWIVLDPERIVSGLHCRIEGEANRFVLTDLSTNGVFVDNGHEALGFGTSVELRDGSRLLLGDAELLVRLEAESEEASSAREMDMIGPSFVDRQSAQAPDPIAVIDHDWFRPIVDTAPLDPLEGLTLAFDLDRELSDGSPYGAPATADPPNTLEPPVELDTAALLSALDKAGQDMTMDERRAFNAKLAAIVQGLARGVT